MPIIVRIALRLLKALDIPLKERLKTPFDRTYKTMTIEKLSISKDNFEEFIVKNKKGYNNIEIIAHKCYEIFHSNEKN